ncbi:MAG: hypothetical protein NUW37_12675 [Planctomycetes bacterium]|nr:hypothetical protein [Planctomycetota bacterium]
MTTETSSKLDPFKGKSRHLESLAPIFSDENKTAESIRAHVLFWCKRATASGERHAERGGSVERSVTKLRTRNQLQRWFWNTLLKGLGLGVNLEE